MTYIERKQLLNSPDYIAQCTIALCDWVGYWAINGTDSIEDENLRNMTDNFISSYLQNSDEYVYKIAILAITEPSIKESANVTDQEVTAAVTHLMSTGLSYIL